MKFTKIKTIFLLFLFINLIPFFCLAATADNSYKPMEGIPGIIQPNQAVDFPTYLMAIYKFGLWAIGVSAMFMIMIGGYMYLTSAGNNSQTGKAKGVITDAIAGLVLALVSYVLLWTINPDLVKFKPLSVKPGAGVTTSSTGTGGTGTGGTYANYAKACPQGDSVAVATDFSKATQDSTIQLDSNCNKFDTLFNSFGQQYNVNSKILKTIAQIESTCGARKGESPAKCCGLMQLSPDTATRLNGSAVTCAQLIVDDSLSIKLAAKYVKESGYMNDSEKLFAGYNSGYGTSKTSEGKLPALAKSNDCSTLNILAFQCCKNPGELKETIDYVWKAKALMNK